MNWKKHLPIRLVKSADIQNPKTNDIVYRYTRPDHTEWLRFKDGSEVQVWWTWGWGADRIIEYWMLSVSPKSNSASITATEFHQSNVSIGNTNLMVSYGNGSKELNSDYANCRCDLYEVDYPTWTLINTWKWNVFADASEVYSFCAANASNNWSTFNNAIYARFYDVIDDSIIPINKMAGKNTLISVLKGRNNYFKWWNAPWGSFMNEPWNGCNWGNATSFIQSIISQCTPYSYTYDAIEEPRRMVWLPSTKRGYYANINPNTEISKWGWNRRSLSWGWAVIAPTSVFNIDLYRTKYISLNLSTQWFNVNSAKSPVAVTKDLWELNLSLAVAYSIKQNNDDNYAVTIRPIGIDTVYIDYVDTDNYDLYGVYKARNQYPRIKKIDLTSANKHRPINVTRITKDMWMERDYSYSYTTKNWAQKFPDVHFVLRDKVTWKVSRLSNSKIYLEQGRNEIWSQFLVK